MHKTKLLTGILLVLAVLFAQVGTVFAAPTAQGTTLITGTIVSVEPEPDMNGVVNTVLVTYKDSAGVDHTVRLSLATAAALGLVTVDTTSTPNTVTVIAQVGAPVTIDPATVIPVEEEDVHPIAAILASFFGKEPGEVDDLHEEGFGFGVIAQALWMEKNILDNELSDIEITAEMILQAKKNKDFSAFNLTDGTTITNWGQFRKAVLDKKNNLGVIVSGHADDDGTDTVDMQNKGNGHGKDKNKHPGRGNGRNNNP